MLAHLKTFLKNLLVLYMSTISIMTILIPISALYYSALYLTPPGDPIPYHPSSLRWCYAHLLQADEKPVDEVAAEAKEEEDKQDTKEDHVR